MIAHPSLGVHVDAHCGVGAPSYIAPEHSVRRALKAATMLSAKGVSPDRISATAWGMDVGVAHLWPPSRAFARAELYIVLPRTNVRAPSHPAYYEGITPFFDLDRATLADIIRHRVDSEDEDNDDDIPLTSSDDDVDVDSSDESSDDDDDDDDHGRSDRDPNDALQDNVAPGRLASDDDSDDAEPSPLDALANEILFGYN